MTTHSILKSTAVELVLVIDDHSYFAVCSGSTRRLFTRDVNDAVEAYNQEVERLRGCAIKILENRFAKPWQNVISRFVNRR